MRSGGLTADRNWRGFQRIGLSVPPAQEAFQIPAVQVICRLLNVRSESAFVLLASHIRANVVSGSMMADYSHILFNKSPLQLRQLGARGGKAYGRNQRLRRALLPAASEAVQLRAAPQETTAKAIATLETRFPWLSGQPTRRDA